MKLAWTNLSLILKRIHFGYPTDSVLIMSAQDEWGGFLWRWFRIANAHCRRESIYEIRLGFTSHMNSCVGLGSSGSTLQGCWWQLSLTRCALRGVDRVDPKEGRRRRHRPSFPRKLEHGWRCFESRLSTRTTRVNTFCTEYPGYCEPEISGHLFLITCR